MPNDFVPAAAPGLPPPVPLAAVSLPRTRPGPRIPSGSDTALHPLVRMSRELVGLLVRRPAFKVWLFEAVAAEVIRRDHAARLRFANDNAERAPW